MNSKIKSTNLFHSVKFSYSLLNKKNKYKLNAFIFTSIVISSLDLIAIGFLSITLGLVFSESNFTNNHRVTVFITEVLSSLGIILTSSQLFISMCFFSMFLFLAKTVLMAINHYLLALFLAKQHGKIADRLTLKFFNSSLDLIARISSQEAAYLLNHAIHQSISVGLNSLVIMLTELTLLAGISGILIFFYPFQTIVMIVFFSLVIIASHFILSEKSHFFGELATRNYLSSFNRIQEAISLHRVLLASFQHINFTRQVKSQVQLSAKGWSMQGFLSQLPKTFLEISIVLSIVLFAIYQLIFDSNGSLIPLLSVFIISSFRLAPSFIKLQGNFLTLKSLQPVIERLKSFKKNIDSDEANSNDEFHQTPMLPERIADFNFVPSLKLFDVTFKFAHSGAPVLNGLNLEIQPFEFVGIQGPTGSGKSTLIDIALGLRKPSSGLVLLGGVDPVLAPSFWPNQISYSSQKTSLIRGTLAENVALGLKPSEIDMTRVEFLLDFLKLNDRQLTERGGSNLVLGIDGQEISGGQRQRVGLARALYWKPKFLVLDEITSSQDEEMEKTLTECLQYLRGDCTIILVSHRPKTLKICDRVISL